LQNRVYLRLEFVPLMTMVNGFRALLECKGEQQTDSDCRYVNGKAFPGMNCFMRGMGFEHGRQIT
jgi:hypothetical protein